MFYSYDRTIYSYERRADSEDLERRFQNFGRIVQGLEHRELEFSQGKEDWATQINAGAMVRASFHTALLGGARQFFWEILQTFALSPKDRKVIERANRTFAKSKVNRIKPEKAYDAYTKMLEDFRLFYATAKRALSSKKHTDEDVDTTLQAGAFTLVNVGGFSDKQMQEASKVVQAAERLLKSKGLGKVCYGTIQVTNTIGRSTRVLAFYTQQGDQMFVRANLKGKQGPAVTSVLHELGHRLHYRFLKSKDSEIRGIYQALMGQESDKLRALMFDKDSIPAPGATISGGKNDVWVSEGTTQVKGTKVYLRVHLENNPTRSGLLPLEAWFTFSGALTFVSAYAKTSYEENFAEMIAHYCEGHLPANQVKMLEAVL